MAQAVHSMKAPPFPCIGQTSETIDFTGVSGLCPIITFPSRLVFLKNLPTLVMYCPGFSSKCVETSCGVVIFMERYLYI